MEVPPEQSNTLTAMWHFCRLGPKGALRVNTPQQGPHKRVIHRQYGMSCRYEPELPQACVKTQISCGGSMDAMLQPEHNQEGEVHCFISLKCTLILSSILH